jgi:hypothetical protein
MAYTETDLPPLLCRLIENPQASPSDQQTTQGQLATERTVSDENGQAFFDAINKAEALELYSAVRDIRPNASVEIGFCCAGSGMAILKALDDNRHGTHHACDPYQTSYAGAAGLKNVEAAGLQARLRFFEDFPENVVPKLPRLQFGFIDASHLFDLSMLDFVLVDKMLDVGGVLGFHDLWMPSLQKLVRFIISNRAYEVYRAPGQLPVVPRLGPLRRAATAIARVVPRANKVFAPELLRPWAHFGIPGNIALLRKTAEDRRDWRHFVPF